MSRLLAAMVSMSVLLAALAACSATNSPDAGPRPRERTATCEPDLDRAFRAWERAGFSGSVALSTGGEFDCLAGYGLADRASNTPNTAETVFSIGSVSKAFTAAAVFRLVDAGKLTLDDRAGDLLPDLTGPVAEATVEQLLVHTSGLTGSHGHDHEALTRGAAIDAIGRLELAFEPGTDSLYSNAGYTLLALIVDEVSATTYRRFLATEVLRLSGGRTAGGFWDGKPAAPGPRAVGYIDEGPTRAMGDFTGPHWALSGNGDLAMTTRDLADWTYALFTDRVVSPESTEVIASPAVDHGDGTAETPGWVAIDAGRIGEPFLLSSGGGGDIGHEVVVAWLPESQRVIAIASNTTDVRAGELLRSVGPALAAGEALPTPEPTDELDPAEAADLTGSYRLGTDQAHARGDLVVRVRDGRLTIAARSQEAIATLFPMPDDLETRVDDHEAGVHALLAGESQAGRAELATLESDLGPLEDVTVIGTAIEAGELRTYVRVRTATDTMRLWYALDPAGAVAAVEGPVPPPTRRFVPAGGSRYLLDAPAGLTPEVTVRFRADRLTITSPSDTTTARRRG